MTTNKAVRKLKHRNMQVEAEKTWETSKTRILSFTLATYLVALIFMIVINIEQPASNALIPTAICMISSRSIPVIKRLWFRWYMMTEPDKF